MKEKKLLRALGNVDNQYIKEAEPMKKTSKITNRQKWVSVAACFVLVVVIGWEFFKAICLVQKRYCHAGWWRNNYFC